jgi:hypothetical protein
MVVLATRDQALAALANLSGIKERTFAPTKNYGFKEEKEGQVVYRFGDADDKLPVNLSAWRSVYRASGLQPNVMGKFPPSLVIPLVDYSFRNSENEVRALIKDDEIIGFTKATGVGILPPKEILAAMEKGVGKKEIDGYQIFGGFDRNNVTLVGKQHKKMGETENKEGRKVGDIVNYGVSLFYSPFGYAPPGGGSALELSGFLHRLACTNGAIATDNVMRFGRKDGEGDVFNWLTERTEKVYEQAQKQLNAMRALKDVPLGTHNAEALDSIFREFGIPTAVREMVIKRQRNFPVTDLYGLMNHITYVASNYRRVLEDPNLMRRLMSVGGNIIQHSALCPKCHRVLPRKVKKQEEQEEEVTTT